MIKFISLLSSAFLLSQSSYAATNINLCLPSGREEVVIISLLMAKEKGYFQKHNLNINLIISGNEQDKLIRMPKKSEIDLSQFKKSLISSGVEKDFNLGNMKCDISVINVESFFARPELIQDYRPLHMVTYGDSYDTNLIVKKDAKIKNLKDLVGKNVRLGRVPTYAAIEKALNEEGLKLNDLKSSREQVTEIFPQLENNNLIAAVSYFPTMPAMIASGKVKILKENIYKTYLKIPIPKSVVVASKSFFLNQQAVIQNFIAALNEAEDYGNKNPSQLALVFKNNTKLMGMKNWNVKNSELEKIDEFYTSFQPIFFNQKNVMIAGKNYSPVSIIEDYNLLLKNSGFVSGVADFSSWK